MALFLRYAVRSDLGLVRTNNEDSVYAGPRLLAIADGMGGHAAGEVASKIVIEMMESLDEDRRIDDLSEALRSTVLAANRRIAAAVAERKELEGMGTTLTALRFSGSKVGLVHVGDSRAYLVRNDQLSQITHDDTYVQYLVDSGKLTEDEAKDHPRKSVILRALLGTDVELDVSMREARHGDRYLLCSDGLSDVVSAETILDTLRIDDPQEAADRLVELALRGGGPDNVTVIVADAVNSRAGGTIDDVPVIAGAFVDPAAADIPESDSAAGRAALISRPKAPAGAPAAEPEKRRRRFSLRGWLFLFLLLALLASGMGAAYAWTQTQYFVGRDGSNVAIYRGVNTEVGPLKLFTVAKRTALKFDDLNPSVQSQVSDGITANNRKSADRVVVNLRSQRLPVCPSAPPSGSPTAPSSPTASGSRPAGTASTSPSPKRSVSPSRAVSSRRRAAAPVSSTVRSRVSSATSRALAASSAAPTGAVPAGSLTSSAAASLVPSSATGSATGSAASTSTSASGVAPSGAGPSASAANPSGTDASGSSGSPAAAKRDCRSGP